MFLELWTLVVLVMVLVVKYGTWKHTGILEHEKLELERAVYYNEQLYKVLREKRQAAEAEQEKLKQERSALATHLNNLNQELKAQKDKNRVLERRLG